MINAAAPSRNPPSSRSVGWTIEKPSLLAKNIMKNFLPQPDLPNKNMSWFWEWREEEGEKQLWILESIVFLAEMEVW